MALLANVGRTLRNFHLPRVIIQRLKHSSETLNDEEFNEKYVNLFLNPSTDGWRVRSLMNDLQGLDLVPEPVVIEAGLKACRRLNDYALAVRFLEAVKFKCGNHEHKIWPYIIQEIKPTIEELGIETPEQLGYDKPELHLKSVYDD